MKDDATNVSHAKHMSMWLVIIIGTMIIVLFFAFVVYELYVMSNPVCAHPGCDEPPESGSEYCAVHKPKSHSYYSSYKYTTATKSTTRKKQTTTYRSTKRTTKKATTTQKNYDDYDEYDVYDYDDPEDFYYDHYDDFWDYYDAEDYWEEHN